MRQKVLLVVIDAATPHVVCPAIRTGRLPVLSRLVDAGAMHEASASIFPSITPAATTSIITGAYPGEHGIAGASWFEKREDRVAYYGDDFWVIAREGFGEFVRDFLLRLNGDRLSAPTAFEMIERTGRLAASINYLVFRGNVPHRVNVPGLLTALPGVPFTETVEGPSTLYLGDFVGEHVHGHKLDDKGGLLHRFGMDDASTGEILRELASRHALPDFTVAYFADNDYRSHEVGPVRALTVVERVDRMLGEAFEAAGGIERVLADTWIVVTSDHGHCDVLDDPDRAVIRLDRTLADFAQAELGRPWRSRDDIMICPNMRAAQIYVQHSDASKLERIVELALADPRVDQAMWRTERTRPGAEGYTVATRRGRLEFMQAGTGGVRDSFGGRWTWRGDAAALSLDEEGGEIAFGEYPNAFERIAGALDHDTSGDLWLTARPGSEFEVPGGKAHVGGASHGALHSLDSLTPVVAAGPRPVKLPRSLRTIDLAPFCLDLLGVPMRYSVGAPRRSVALEAGVP